MAKPDLRLHKITSKIRHTRLGLTLQRQNRTKKIVQFFFLYEFFGICHLIASKSYENSPEYRKNFCTLFLYLSGIQKFDEISVLCTDTKKFVQKFQAAKRNRPTAFSALRLSFLILFWVFFSTTRSDLMMMRKTRGKIRCFFFVHYKVGRVQKQSTETEYRNSKPFRFSRRFR